MVAAELIKPFLKVLWYFVESSVLKIYEISSVQYVPSCRFSLNVDLRNCLVINKKITDVKYWIAKINDGYLSLTEHFGVMISLRF